MIKRTLCFSNSAFLSVANGQLIIKVPAVEVSNGGTTPSPRSIPIEDIGMVVLDHPQIVITHTVFSELLNNNAAIITCSEKHLPVGLLLPLEGNTTQCERFHAQINASLSLRKQMWQQTVSQKIANQAAVLKRIKGVEVRCMQVWANAVKSGDSDNLEGRAAAYYWKQLFSDSEDWTRNPNGQWPNPLFNYGYAILRAIVARALVASGMLPTLGVHHHNRYNAYCLADDIMEPYRPYVDQIVMQMFSRWQQSEEITVEMKQMLLSLPTTEVTIGGIRSPLMIAVSQTTASLYKCFNSQLRRIVYPSI